MFKSLTQYLPNKKVHHWTEKPQNSGFSAIKVKIHLGLILGLLVSLILWYLTHNSFHIYRKSIYYFTCDLGSYRVSFIKIHLSRYVPTS